MEIAFPFHISRLPKRRWKMLFLQLPAAPHRIARRLVSTSARLQIKRIKQVTSGNLTTVELENVPEPPNVPQFRPALAQTRSSIGEEEEGPQCCCVLCLIPARLSYKDVLVLEQFMRLDGTILPMQITGLCEEQQQRLERCVMQAHWSGLFPDRTIADFDRSDYKRFNRHWEDDLDIFRLKFKMQPGSWFYVKRYNPRAAEYRGRRGGEKDS